VDVSERGAILIFVLVLLTFVSIGVGPLFALLFANANATSVVQATDNGFYATDGGIEYAIQLLRAGAACSQLPWLPVTAPSSLDEPGQLPTTVTASCLQTTPLILTAHIVSSFAEAATETAFTTTAVVAIDLCLLAGVPCRPPSPPAPTPARGRRASSPGRASSLSQPITPPTRT